MLELDKTEQTITPTHKGTQTKNGARADCSVIKKIKQKKESPYVVMSEVDGTPLTHATAE